MYGSVHRALGGIAAHLSPVLVPESCRLKLGAFAAGYPEFGQTQYLECRLGHEDCSQVDLLWSAATSFERASLGRVLARRPIDDPVLWPLQRLVAGWGAPTSKLHDAVPLVWLEFDHLEVDPRPVACLGICLAPAYLDPHAALPEQPRADVLATILESLRLVGGEPADARVAERFDRSLGSLPPGARWIHLSVMSGRDPAQLKLYGVFPQAAVLPFLKEVGWAGDHAALTDLLGRYCPEERTGGLVYLDFPVAGMPEAQANQIGIVFAQQQLRHARDTDPGRSALLRQLVTDGLCTPAQCAALAAWPGNDAEAPALPPASQRRPMQVARWLDVKLVLRPSRGLQAKAYLGFLARLALSAQRPAESSNGPESAKILAEP